MTGINKVAQASSLDVFVRGFYSLPFVPLALTEGERERNVLLSSLVAGLDPGGPGRYYIPFVRKLGRRRTLPAIYWQEPPFFFLGVKEDEEPAQQEPRHVLSGVTAQAQAQLLLVKATGSSCRRGEQSDQFIFAATKKNPPHVIRSRFEQGPPRPSSSDAAPVGVSKSFPSGLFRSSSASSSSSYFFLFHGSDRRPPA